MTIGSSRTPAGAGDPGRGDRVEHWRLLLVGDGTDAVSWAGDLHDSVQITACVSPSDAANHLRGHAHMFDGALVDARSSALDARQQVASTIDAIARDLPVVVLLPGRAGDTSWQESAGSVAWLFDTPQWHRQLPAALLTARCHRAALIEARRLFEAERAGLTAALLDTRTELAAVITERSMLLTEQERAAAALRMALLDLTGRSGSQGAVVTADTVEQDDATGPASADDDAVSGGIERRRHARVSGSFGGERIGLMDTPVQIQNLSAGGCFVKSYYPPPDTRFDLRLDLGDGIVVEVEVETVFVAPEIGYGVSFVNLSEPTRRRIVDAVAAEQRAGGLRRGTPARTGG